MRITLTPKLGWFYAVSPPLRIDSNKLEDGAKGNFILPHNQSSDVQNDDSRSSSLRQRLAQAWKSNSKFTIHPFKSLHTKNILPLSLTDYVSRFSLELVVLAIAIFAVWNNFSLTNNNANGTSVNDQSIIFSFIKNHPNLNHPLIAADQTSTILAKNDQLVTRSSVQSGIILAASIDNSTPSGDPTTIQDDVVVKTNPADTETSSKIGITQYEVAAGDTPCGIASNLGISCGTLLQANNLTSNSVIQPGQSLTILPTTGITHTITDKDTLQSILDTYKISEENFLDANNLESFDDLAVGAIVVIPLDNVAIPSAPKPASQFVKNDSGQVPLTQAAAPADFSNNGVSFIWPTYIWKRSGHTDAPPTQITADELTPLSDITQGFSSRHTGLDISDSQREPVYAAADGYVEIAGYQTNGYGNTILINDGNGFKTRYGHATELYVKAGDYVKQGQLIAEQGNTGRTTGVTGIHLHFEIIKNGVRVNPLGYVKP